MQVSWGVRAGVGGWGLGAARWAAGDTAHPLPNKQEETQRLGRWQREPGGKLAGPFEDLGIRDPGEGNFLWPAGS